MAGGVGVTGNGLDIQTIREAEDGDLETGVSNSDASAWMTSLSDLGFDQEIMDELQALIDSGVGYDEIANFLDKFDLDSPDTDGVADGVVGRDDAEMVKKNTIDLNWINNSSGLDMDATLDPNKKDEWLGKLEASGMGEDAFNQIKSFFNDGITNQVAVDLLEALDAADGKEDDDLDAADIANLSEIQIYSSITKTRLEETVEGAPADEGTPAPEGGLREADNIIGGSTVPFSKEKEDDERGGSTSGFSKRHR